MLTDPPVRSREVPARHRFLAAQDSEKTNLGKFSLLGYDDEARAHVPLPLRTPLLASVNPVARFGGAIAPSALWLLDLQTREGTMFDPADSPEQLRARFLMHPVHVCILYLPLLLHLARHAAEIWTMGDLVTVRLEDVVAQPGLLVDRNGRPVRRMSEWSRRAPLAARFRNRAVPPEEDGQALLTPDELDEQRAGTRPMW